MALLLTVQNLTGSAVAINQPIGTVPASGAKSIELTVAELEKIRSLLVRFQTQRVITWRVDNTRTGDEDADFVTLADVPEASGTSLLTTPILTTPTTPVHMYVDGTTGNDSLSGDDPLLALQTIDEAIRRLNRQRRILVPTLVHLATPPSPYEVTEVLGPIELFAPLVFIGDDYTELLTGTVDVGASTLNIPVTGGGLTPGAFFGKMLELTSGASQGWRRTLNDNDASSLDVDHYFALGAPSSGDSFRITEPAVQINFPRPTPGATGRISELFRVVGTGQTVANPRRNLAFYSTSTAMVYFVNLKLASQDGAASNISMERSTINFVGCEFGDGAADNGPVLISDEASLVLCGMDFFLAVPRLCMALEAGLIAGDDPRVWAGWSSVWNAIGAASVLGCARFVGFMHSDDQMRFEGGTVTLVGGRINSTQGQPIGLDVSEGGHLILEGSASLRPLLIENDDDDLGACCVCVRGGSTANIKDVQLTKTNRGHGILVYANDSGQGALPGMVSLSSTTSFIGVVDAGTPTNCVRVTGGSRCNFRANPSVSGTWDDECAVAATESAAPAAGASGAFSDLASEGDAFPTVASGLDGRNGWIQTH